MNLICFQPISAFAVLKRKDNSTTVKWMTVIKLPSACDGFNINRKECERLESSEKLCNADLTR